MSQLLKALKKKIDSQKAWSTLPEESKKEIVRLSRLEILKKRHEAEQRGKFGR